MRKLKKEQLEKIIAKGKWSCVLLYGVLGFGIIMATGLSLIDLAIDGKPFWESFQRLIVIGPSLGIIYGLFLWRSFNKQYKKLSST